MTNAHVTNQDQTLRQAQDIARLAQKTATELLETAKALQAAIAAHDSFRARQEVTRMDRLEHELSAMLGEIRGRIICL